ncbi:MAG: alpha/beta hydrolase [Eubacteriales bacterium]|nr:alpha/beta hydrolase [Eubacteriales bacterium]
MKTETIILNKERNVTLTSYLLEVNGEFKNIHKRPAVFVLPGGGYRMCSEREAEPVAFAYLNAGFHTFILNYSVGSHAEWPNPLSDYEQAMSMIREHAEEWNLYQDKIAVIGFSAGGHLAASAATVAVNKPNAAILGYAVTEEKTAKMCLKSAPDIVSQVNRETCPCFVFASRNDNVVPIRNSIKFVDALAANGVIFENHIYAYGPHGFSTANASTLMPGMEICSRASHWVEDSIAWLGDIWGEFGNGEMTLPRCISETKEDNMHRTF